MPRGGLSAQPLWYSQARIPGRDMPKRRRKPRLFSFPREVEIANFDEVVTDPRERIVLEALVDAFWTICQTHAVRPETLLPMARAARHASAHVRGVGITRLTVLTHYFDEASEVLEAIARDEDESVRLYATAALANTPSEVGTPLIRRATTDPSWRVRKAAAQAAGAVAWPELVPILTEARDREPDARVKVVLQLALEFQQSGQGP